MEIDFTDSQLPPDELEEVRRRYSQEWREEEERFARKLARVRLAFGAEEYIRGGLGMSESAYPLLTPES